MSDLPFDRLKPAAAGAALAAALVLGACGGSADSVRAAHEARAAAKGAAEAAQAAAGPDDSDMVSAVGGNGSLTPVSLRFRFGTAPRVGEALQVELALAQDAQVQIDDLLVTLLPGDGLALESSRSLELHAPAAGTVQHLSATLRPQQAGFASLTATVLVNSGNSSIARSFSIPIIVAAP
jgi:hypothetical protein